MELDYNKKFENSAIFQYHTNSKILQYTGLTYDVNVFQCTPFHRERHIYWISTGDIECSSWIHDTARAMDIILLN